MNAAVASKAVPVKAEASAKSAQRTATPATQLNPTWELLALGAQAKLAVSSPDDPAEHEADRIADAVMNGSRARFIANRSPVSLSRKCAQCEEEELDGVVALKRSNGEMSSSIDSSAVSALGEGSRLPATTQSFFDSRLGADLSRVRVHTDSNANDAARGLGALAFTVGNDIAFARGQYDPHGDSGRRLLAHELVHVLQQTDSGSSAGVSRVDQPMIQRSVGSDLVDANTSWGSLDEETLGAELLTRAEAGEFSPIEEALDYLGSTDRDDVAFELMVRMSEATLDQMAQTATGRGVLDRLFDELTAGSVSDEETEQANRIMTAKARLASVEDFAAAMEHAKIFPYRLPGLTVFHDAPIDAERRSGGRIWVTQPVRVNGTDEFQAELDTLPDEVFTSGIELPETEIVGVRMYDLGGVIVFRPALFLIQLSNETNTTILAKMVEAGALGLTLGSGALVEGGAEAGLLARTFLWADRAALALGTLTSIINEHRGWILEQFGDEGAEFLRYVDMVNSAVAVYGGIRAVVGVVQLIAGLRRSYLTWRALANSADSELSASERAVVTTVSSETDDFLRNADEAASAESSGAAGVDDGATTPPRDATPDSAATPDSDVTPDSAATPDSTTPDTTPAPTEGAEPVTPPPSAARALSMTREAGLTSSESSLLARIREYFELPPVPTESNSRIVGALIPESGEPIPIHSGESGGPWGGTDRGGIPRGPGSGADRYTLRHVEGHAAAIMRERGMTRAWLLIERPPCPACGGYAPGGADFRTPNFAAMLPDGAQVLVIDPDSATYFRSVH